MFYIEMVKIALKKKLMLYINNEFFITIHIIFVIFYIACI